MVKFFAFFSRDFACLNYGDAIYSVPEQIHTGKGEFKVFSNPNLRFLDSDVIRSGREKLQSEIPTEMVEFTKLAKCFQFLEFDPRSSDQVRMLGLILSLPVMGGYGRANKNAVAPKSAKDQQIGSEIGPAFVDRIKRAHYRAIFHGMMPVNESEWLRGTLGMMKSTSAAEKQRVLLTERDGSVKAVPLSTKAVVGVVRGMKIFTSDMDRRFDTPATAINAGARDVPVKSTRCIYPIQLSVLAAESAVVNHIVRYAISNKGTYSPSDPDFASSISSGSDESIGSRIIDDMDLLHFSGNPNLLVIGVDYGEYDSHCTWKNFREPILMALEGYI